MFEDRNDAGRQLVKANAGLPMPAIYEEAGAVIQIRYKRTAEA
jgi:hypothetical protein